MPNMLFIACGSKNYLRKKNRLHNLMRLKHEAVQPQVMTGTQEGILGDTDLQPQLRDSWRKPRGQQEDRRVFSYI